MAQVEKLKRSTIYLDPALHKALKMKSVESDSTISEIVNEAVREALQEDLDDLRVCDQRSEEKTLSYEQMLKRLNLDGKI